MSFSLRNLWRNLFPGSASSASELLPTKVTAPMSPVQPPRVEEPSCFVKGLALSLTTPGDIWRETPYEERCREGWVPIPVVDLTDAPHGVRVVALGRNDCAEGGNLLPGCEHISSVIVYNPDRQRLDTSDAAHIARALEANPPAGTVLKYLIEGPRREAERKAKAIAHFEQLGCPPSS